jgi:Porin subfamily
MKMVKSLLLGSAAALAAVTAGQAADLPVKAKPVEYVKVCSLYGAGFYYMPGTDMCIKIGGWTRAEVSYGINGNSSVGWWNNDVNTRVTNNMWSRERGYITADAREQTAYGVARGYIAVGISSQNNGNEAPSSNFSSNRAFVQWAGMTAGLTVSFFDYYPAAALLIRAGLLPQEDSGDGGIWVWGYTAQLGNGLGATISAEERRTSQIIGTSSSGSLLSGSGVLPSGTFAAGGGYGGWQAPDIVGNLRLDQTWGGGQIMGALHQLNPLYYGSSNSTTVADGHPSDQWGWVIGAGLRLNFPMVAQGDYFVTEANYTQGATKYLWNSNSDENDLLLHGANEAYAVGSDCVYGGLGSSATGCQKTTAWEVDAAYEHYWTPQVHESFVVAYMNESYDQSANAMLCSVESQGSGGGLNAVAHAGCNNNWNVWGGGSRLQWDITKSLYIGVEVVYANLHSATLATTSGGFLPSSLIVPGSGATYQNSNENTWAASVRLHKDFLP